MCLMIHKPVGVALPRRLLQSAAAYNRDGFGIMACADDGTVITVKRSATRVWELLATFEDFAIRECTLHFRSRTSGEVDDDNTHPIHVVAQIFLMHNGTLDIPRRSALHSDAWNLVHDYLRPALSKSPDILHRRHFQRQLQQRIGPENRLVFVDGGIRRTIVINAEAGVQFKGLWISNTRYIDSRLLGLPPSHPLVVPVRGRRLHYL